MVNTFIKKLIERNFSFFTGVPCSLLSEYFREIETYKKDISYVSALREDVAVGMAVGSTLAGKKAVVLMQNSGLGASINALASLVLPFGVPMLFIISVRGYHQDKDTAENIIMGSITLDLLEKLDIEARVLEPNNSADIIEWASSVVNNGRCAAVLVVDRKAELRSRENQETFLTFDVRV